MAMAATSTMEEKLTRLKQEIRAILVSADSGMSPEQLNRDYYDINGRVIPYAEFGYRNIFHFLDGIPDTAHCYQQPGGSLLLFAKSVETTQHIESLISRQLHQSRIGRFGGIINKPPELCRGTSQRRDFITRRLLDVFENRSGFVYWNDVLKDYQSRYGERLDPDDDFNCSLKRLFEVKLSNHFEIKEVGRGGFWVRLKKEATERSRHRSEGSTSSTGFPEGRPVVAATPPQPSLAGSSPAKVVNPNAAFGVVGSKAEEEKKTASLPQMATASRPCVTIQNAVEPKPILEPGNPINPPSMASTQQPIQPTDPINQSKPTNPINSFAPTVRSQIRTTPYHHAPLTPMLSKQFDEWKRKENILRLFDNFSNGVELAVFDWAYFSVNECSLFPQGSDSGEEAVLKLLNDLSIPFDRIKKVGDQYLIVGKSTPCIGIAPKLLLVNGVPTVGMKGMVLDDAEKKPGDRLASKLRQNADQSGTACHESVTSNEAPLKNGQDQNMTTLASFEQLKDECRKVLRAYPDGIMYLDFIKAYIKIVGKNFNVSPFGFDSLVEVMDAMPDLFVVERDDRKNILLTERKLLNEDKETRDPSGKNEYLDISPDENLMKTIWKVIMFQPKRTLALREIPSAYERNFGSPFPRDDLDVVGLEICEQYDLFSAQYIDDDLLVTAEPDGTCV